MKIIDSHIHLDQYEKAERGKIMKQLANHHVEALITVSTDYASGEKNLSLSQADSRVKVALGFHPEQILPPRQEIDKVFQLIKNNQDKIIAIGEVGLPYYLRRKNPAIQLKPYIELLEEFIVLAKQLDKPIILHAIYEDASLVCDLLEKHGVKRAHFHWFKGDEATLARLINQGHVISVTPDVCYELEIQRIVELTPLEHILVETDGPWPFKGQFAGKMTDPKMIHETIKKISQIKQVDLEAVYCQIRENTRRFFCL